MDVAYLRGQMVALTTDNMKTIINRDMESSTGQMERSTQEIGYMVNNMVKGKSLFQMESHLRADGKTERKFSLLSKTNKMNP